MAWRVHLTNQAIQSLFILPGRQPVLGAWTRRDQVMFYDVASGAPLGEKNLPTPPDGPRGSDEWQEFVGVLTGPTNRFYLPVVRLGTTTLYSTDDGKMRLYHIGDAGLFLETDGKEIALELDLVERFLAVELDRELGLVAALDEKCLLHLYQQNIYIGAFDIGLKLEPGLRPALAVSQGGGTIFATDGQRIVMTDTGGLPLQTLETHYAVGRMVCSPGGGMVITSEIESGVLRLYDGEDLSPTHQRHAFDLAVSATQVQLLAELPPASAAVTAISAFNRGMIAFAMFGVICMTDATFMNPLPRPQPLL